jgi:uncharacterized membrane protein
MILGINTIKFLMTRAAAKFMVFCFSAKYFLAVFASNLYYRQRLFELKKSLKFIPAIITTKYFIAAIGFKFFTAVFARPVINRSYVGLFCCCFVHAVRHITIERKSKKKYFRDGWG